MMFFSRTDLLHFKRILKIAFEHGHKDCGFCHRFYEKVEKALSNHGLGNKPQYKNR